MSETMRNVDKDIQNLMSYLKAEIEEHARQELLHDRDDWRREYHKKCKLQTTRWVVAIEKLIGITL